MKFSEYEYIRPDFKIYQAEAKAVIEKLKQALDEDEACAAVIEMNRLMIEQDKQVQIAFIRHTIDTKDAFYEAEDDYWNEYLPLYDEIYNEYYRALLNSAYRSDLVTVLPEQYFKMAEYKLKTFSPEVIEFLQKENELRSAYNKLIASAKIDFDNQTLNLSQLGPYMQSTDRDVREKASKASSEFYQQNEEKLDDIYDQLVHVRDQIAKTLGFKDFVELGYIRMERYDYDREMVQVYREQILKKVVPVVDKLNDRQAKRIGIEDLQYYDLNLKFLDGNAAPKGDSTYIKEMGRKMYQ